MNLVAYTNNLEISVTFLVVTFKYEEALTITTNLQIFDSFYRHDLLSASDREKFKELYEQTQTEDVNSKQDFSHGEQCRIHNKQINQREALLNATVQHTQSNCRLPKVSGAEYPPEENLLSRYISSMPIANP